MQIRWFDAKKMIYRSFQRVFKNRLASFFLDVAHARRKSHTRRVNTA